MNPRPTLLSALLPPMLSALGYAAAKTLAQGSASGGLYWQSPAMYSFFAGLLVALGLRPILTRVPWKRGTAFAFVLACYLAIGPLAAWAEALLLEAAGAMGFPYALRRDAKPELLAAWVGAGLLAWLYRPRGGDIGWRSLRARMLRRPPSVWGPRLALLGLAIAAISFASGLADATLARSGWMQPLSPANPWLRLSMAGLEQAGWLAVPVILAGSWLRGLALAIPLWAIALVTRGARTQLALVFGLVVFILGGFAPLIEDQPFPSQTWLSLRVALEAIEAIGIGLAAAWLIGPLSPQAGMPPE
jgi:hypothetical protein